MVSVEPELVEHREVVRQVTAAAFAASPFGHQGEAELIDRLRLNAQPMLSLVAVQGTDVVGHVLFTPATIHRGDLKLRGMGLGPMSVLPSHQRLGIGSKLVREGLQLLESETLFTIVAGDAHFYRRFGFVPAADFAITHGFAEMPQEAFFIYADNWRVLSDFRGGRAYYHREFGPQH